MKYSISLVFTRADNSGNAITERHVFMPIKDETVEDLICRVFSKTLKYPTYYGEHYGDVLEIQLLKERNP